MENCYIKVEWPESQKFMADKYEDEIYYEDDGMIFVPKEIYDEVNGKTE